MCQAVRGWCVGCKRARLNVQMERCELYDPLANTCENLNEEVEFRPDHAWCIHAWCRFADPALPWNPSKMPSPGAPPLDEWLEASVEHLKNWPYVNHDIDSKASSETISGSNPGDADAELVPSPRGLESSPVERPSARSNILNEDKVVEDKDVENKVVKNKVVENKVVENKVVESTTQVSNGTKPLSIVSGNNNIGNPGTPSVRLPQVPEPSPVQHPYRITIPSKPNVAEPAIQNGNGSKSSKPTSGDNTGLVGTAPVHPQQVPTATTMPPFSRPIPQAPAQSGVQAHPMLPANQAMMDKLMKPSPRAQSSGSNKSGSIPHKRDGAVQGHANSRGLVGMPPQSRPTSAARQQSHNGVRKAGGVTKPTAVSRSKSSIGDQVLKLHAQHYVPVSRPGPATFGAMNSGAMIGNRQESSSTLMPPRTVKTNWQWRFEKYNLIKQQQQQQQQQQLQLQQQQQLQLQRQQQPANGTGPYSSFLQQQQQQQQQAPPALPNSHLNSHLNSNLNHSLNYNPTPWDQQEAQLNLNSSFDLDGFAQSQTMPSETMLSFEATMPSFDMTMPSSFDTTASFGITMPSFDTTPQFDSTLSFDFTVPQVQQPTMPAFGFQPNMDQQNGFDLNSFQQNFDLSNFDPSSFQQINWGQN